RCSHKNLAPPDRIRAPWCYFLDQGCSHFLQARSLARILPLRIGLSDELLELAVSLCPFRRVYSGLFGSTAMLDHLLICYSQLPIVLSLPYKLVIRCFCFQDLTCGYRVSFRKGFKTSGLSNPGAI